MMRMRELIDSARAISTICCCPSRRFSTSVKGSMSSSRPVIRSLVRRSSSAKSTPARPAISRPMKMLSRTFRFGARLSSWWMIEIPCSRASVDEPNATRAPSSSMNPEVGGRMPERIFISVDLPAPFSPNNVVTLPRCTSKFTPFKAWVLPKDLATLRAASTASPSRSPLSGAAII